VGAGEFVKLECRRDAIEAIAAKLDRFGALEGAPDWLISAVWLGAEHMDFIASSSTKVLQDGYIARPLAIQNIKEFEERLVSELVDISGRLTARQAETRLPEACIPACTPVLRSWEAGRYSTKIVIRNCARGPMVHRIACGILFEFEERRLLVATDVATLAMVLSEDTELIERYLASCETIVASVYLKDCGL
jgi:hypothetical protein